MGEMKQIEIKIKGLEQELAASEKRRELTRKALKQELRRLKDINEEIALFFETCEQIAQTGDMNSAIMVSNIQAYIDKTRARLAEINARDDIAAILMGG